MITTLIGVVIVFLCFAAIYAVNEWENRTIEKELDSIDIKDDIKSYSRLTSLTILTALII